jgi:hypothetical protein
MKTPLERFLQKVDKGKAASDCWVWTGSKVRGYGQLRMLKTDGTWTMERAHRYSYKEFNGEFDSSLMVCHTCDNPSCVNPAHLFVGTAKENAQDKVKKGRQPIIRNPKFNNLNKEIAENIRKDYKLGMSYSELEEKYKTSKPQVCRIVLNQIWK